MKIRNGDMFNHLDECDLFVITTNGSVKRDGTLVMGRGAALTFKNRYKNQSIVLSHLARLADPSNPTMYYFVQAGGFGLFQVKREWHESANLEIIKNSTARLTDYAKYNKDFDIFLNYPGIGNGSLEEKDVAPIISTLPDNVIVWKL